MAKRPSRQKRPGKSDNIHSASDSRPSEYALLVEAERRLSVILEAMKPLLEALPRLEAHYSRYQESIDEVMSGAGRSAKGTKQGSGAELVVPETEVYRGLRRPEVRLSALGGDSPPDPEQLHGEMDAFYEAFSDLFRAAAQVNVGPEIRVRLVDEEVPEWSLGGSAEEKALAAPHAAVGRNSITGRHQRVGALLEAVRQRRRVVGLWHTPEGRRELLSAYCQRHGISIDNLARGLKCDRTTIYNWRNCKGGQRSRLHAELERWLREDVKPEPVSNSRDRR